MRFRLRYLILEILNVRERVVSSKERGYNVNNDTNIKINRYSNLEKSLNLAVRKT